MRQTRINRVNQSGDKVSTEKRTPILFTEQEMEKLRLKIDDPEKKAEKLFIKYTHKYKQYMHTSSETAQLLGISEKQLKALRETGEIGWNQSGSNILFYAGDINRFLTKCTKRQEK